MMTTRSETLRPDEPRCPSKGRGRAHCIGLGVSPTPLPCFEVRRQLYRASGVVLSLGDVETPATSRASAIDAPRMPRLGLSPAVTRQRRHGHRFRQETQPPATAGPSSGMRTGEKATSPGPGPWGRPHTSTVNR